MIQKDMVCKNANEVFEKLCAMQYFLFKEKENGNVIFGRYMGIGDIDSNPVLIYENLDYDDDYESESEKIDLSKGLIIMKTWIDEPTDIELLILRNQF